MQESVLAIDDEVAIGFFGETGKKFFILLGDFRIC